MSFRICQLTCKLLGLMSVGMIFGCTSTSLEDTAPVDLSANAGAQVQINAPTEQGSEQGSEQELEQGLELLTDAETLDTQIKLTKLLLARANNSAERAKFQQDLIKLEAARAQLDL